MKSMTILTQANNQKGKIRLHPVLLYSNNYGAEQLV